MAGGESKSKIQLPKKINYRGHLSLSQDEWDQEVSNMLSNENSRDSVLPTQPQSESDSNSQAASDSVSGSQQMGLKPSASNKVKRFGKFGSPLSESEPNSESDSEVELTASNDKSSRKTVVFEFTPYSEQSSDSDSESGSRGVLDCARRPQRTPGSRQHRGGSEKRKSYSDRDYRLILNAENEFKRRIIAEAIDMPWKTAQGIVRRFKKTGRIHDGRKDIDHSQANPRNNPYSQANRGKWGKLSPQYEDYLFQLVHFNCSLTMSSLMDIINKEMTRDFLIQNEESPSELEMSKGATHGLVFGVKALPVNEREKGGPLDTEPFKDVEEFKLFQETCCLRSPQTIANHLFKAGFTRKNIIIEKSTANKPSTMEKRLRMAQTLGAIIEGKVEHIFLIFQDEMPFYLNHTRKRGLSKKGERAVYRGVPTSNMSFRTQVSMAVNPDLGLLVGKQYNPKKIDYVDKHGKKKAKWKSGYTKEDFEDFIHLIMTNIMTLLTDPETNDWVKGNKIILLIDGAPEHGKNAMARIVDRFEHKQRFDELLAENRCTFQQTKLVPNSPHLNLCEYYNRILRAYFGIERNKPEVHREMMRIQGDAEVEVGNIVKNRVDIIHGCIDRAMERLRNNRKATKSNFLNFAKRVDKIIESNGYLNYYEPM